MEKEPNIDPKRFREGNISLILDSYDDIFSDFDPRPYREKALSDDFLHECKKAALDKNKDLMLRLLIPKDKRNFPEEFKIKKRLKEHFMKHYHEKEKEIKGIRRFALLWIIIGGILMLISTTVLFQNKNDSFWFTFLVIFTEPAGWFFFWEGLNKLFNSPREKYPDYNFYKKMAHSEIEFFHYLKIAI